MYLRKNKVTFVSFNSFYSFTCYPFSLFVFLFKDTFLGRFRHFLDVIDPSTLFVSEVLRHPTFIDVVGYTVELFGFLGNREELQIN